MKFNDFLLGVVAGVAGVFAYKNKDKISEILKDKVEDIQSEFANAKDIFQETVSEFCTNSKDETDECPQCKEEK